MKGNKRILINWILIILVVFIFLFHRPSRQPLSGSRLIRSHLPKYRNAHENLQDPEYRLNVKKMSSNNEVRFTAPKNAGNFGKQIENTGAPEEESTQHRYLDYLDLDITVPTVDELYEKLVLVTGFSNNHYKEAMGFISTAQKFMPGKKIIVYDLGITRTDYLKSTKKLCNVQVRNFPFDMYPPHVHKLRKYAWKIAIINMTLNEFGAIYWGDASIRFKDSLKVLIPGVERYHGWFPSILGFDPHKKRTHHNWLTVQGTYDKIGVNRTELMTEANVQPHIQAGNQLIFNSSTVQKSVLRPWVKCGMDKDCIAPPNSSIFKHRYDASALSLIAYKNMKYVFSPNDTNIERLHKIISVKRGTVGFKFKPRTCQ